MKNADNSRVQSTSIRLQEWQEVGPETNPALVDYRFKDPIARQGGEHLTRTGQLELQELHRGLNIKTSHYVGTVQLGDLRIAVLPKITGLPLLNLLRYAYNLRNLNLFDSLRFGVEAGEFQDLLIQQLVREAAELLSRGLYRRYDQVDEALASPRGKINFGVLSRQGGVIDASLPCNHCLRLEDNILNRSLLAGMTLATQLTKDLVLRSELRKSIRILSQSVSTVPVSAQLLKKAVLSINRLTNVYQPAITIIQILLESLGLSIDSNTNIVRSPGFLFDMNRFFQALVERFLKENLQDFTVQEEYRLRGMMSYNPQHKPANKQPLIPRPDFAISQGKQVFALLDTKYRDLWENSLPREMLYQLAVYAFSQDRPGQSAIIYPSLNKDAQEAWIDISHPISQEFLARVILRPVNLYELERMIYQASASERWTFADQIVFGQRAKR
jgi:5-methylcytosine-specific restriction enzyme subunit McrC